ncbi:hypothetical protein GBA52_008302, partial [Prunus armeniaca]
KRTSVCSLHRKNSIPVMPLNQSKKDSPTPYPSSHLLCMQSDRSPTPYFMGSTAAREAKVSDRSGSRVFFVILQMVVKWLWILVSIGV